VSAQPLNTVERGNDPCLQIQVDLSAMLDGELEAASVRRVMVHSDVCASCRGFLESVRSQVRAHRELHDAGAMPGQAVVGGAGRLRHLLIENRQKLSRVLYELGRGFVLMGLSPDFSREVAKEPVPVPDMAMKGRNLVDEVRRLTNGSGAGGEWVTAQELFAQGQQRTPTENLAKGQRLLSECLALAPEHHEAMIYLGLVHHVRGQRALARKQFSLVLTGTADPVMRAFALLNLANVHLEEGDPEGAIVLLLQVVASGVVPRHPRFGMVYFNLALAYGHQGRFDESLAWFRRLHDELPHKRMAVARELTRRSQFTHLLRSHPEAEARLADTLPTWFPVAAKEAV
jgi:tetratricopeptide (TPR) repeat protein